MFFWRNWCLWHLDVVFLTFIWDGASNTLITKNVQIWVFILCINFPKSTRFRVLCGNIARGTTDPGYCLFNLSIALVAKMATR